MPAESCRQMADALFGDSYFKKFKRYTLRKDIKLKSNWIKDTETIEYRGCKFLLEEVWIESCEFEGGLKDKPPNGIYATITHVKGKEFGVLVGVYDDEYWYPAEEALKAFIDGMFYEQR